MVTENQIYTALEKLKKNRAAIETANRKEGEARSKVKAAEKAMNKAIYHRAEAILKDALYRKELINKGIYQYLGSESKIRDAQHLNTVIRIHKETMSEFKNKF